MLNFSPDHLDRHPDVAAYAAAKARIFENQDAGDWAVVNADDPAVLEMARRGRARRRLFARHHGDRRGHGGRRRLDCRTDARRARRRLVPLAAIHLLGPHLVDDVMAAATVGAIAGASPAAMTRPSRPSAASSTRWSSWRRSTACGSSTTRRRRTWRRRCARSRASSAAWCRSRRAVQGRRSAAAARAAAARAKAVVAIGEARGARARGARRRGAVHEADTLDDAVERAYALAQPAGVVLLAPACASFDMFRTTRSADGGSRRRWQRLARRVSGEQSSVGSCGEGLAAGNAGCPGLRSWCPCPGPTDDC